MKKNDLIVILNALVEPVFLVDANRQITLANGAAEELFGEGLVTKEFGHALGHPQALKCVETVLAGQAAAEAIISLPVPVRATYKLSSVRLDGGGRTQGEAVVSLNDISHILEAEQMRSDFVANVSHELRSPLTALSGGIETLKGAAKNDPAARERFLDIMEREAARMTRLIGDLLSLSRVEVNEHVRPSERVNVLAVVEKVVDTLEAQSRAEQKPIVLQSLNGGWPKEPWIVPGDQDQLTQIFQNLIANALKYSRETSEVQISVSRPKKIAGLSGPMLAVAVKDQGEGIPDEHILRLTERFYRVDDSRSREKGGTGLGLAIVKHILNRHRGRLLIESKKGEGSTFTVFLPLEAGQQQSVS
ncbi:MAG: ATP-binding protein [Alphaproteobacteria bacterium]